MLPKWLIPFLVGICNLRSATSLQLQSCQLPNGQPGICVSLQNCATLVPIVQQQQQPPNNVADLAATIDYIQRSLCGYDGGSLLVCCSDPQSASLQIAEAFTFGPLQALQPPSPPSMGGLPQAPQSPVTVIALPPPPPATMGTSPKADDVCGISNFTQTRVVGGTNAKLNAYPWIALLAYQVAPNDPARFLCAGSLISPLYILTTAHCVNDQLVYVRLGEHDISSDQDGATPLDVPIAGRQVHEAYVANLILNDIALLRLMAPVPISAKIRPICLPTSEPLRSADLTGYQPFLAGWGSIAYQGPSPAILQEAQIPVVSNAACEADYRSLFPQQQFDSRVLCAGQGGRDACQGDSGGPLMLPQQLPATGGFYYVLIGLVSYGYECAREGFPGVYTRVAAYVPWIEERMML